MTLSRCAVRALVAWGLLAAIAVHGQEFRDPTTPPPEPTTVAAAASVPETEEVIDELSDDAIEEYNDAVESFNNRAS